MRATLTFELDVPSVQKLTAVRDQCAGWLEDQDVTVVNRLSGSSQRKFRVFGVDITKKQPFEQDTEAETQDEAKGQVESKAKVVANVVPQP